ncbi:hypothetical protein KZZ20_04445 [Methylacidiphilum fumariolicum]|uniref:Large exoprotein involved in heme utilization or adhesion n=2 Tax=Candidatus Methylacidiphilum fumarolicum TaxID=591154 RepID=I0K0P3_METFB|nr:Large exoprotein involved in heme utilization or adhesion [Candidatus Methylacidiphilum fumarolicum]MBW6414765.1 hypothetical protein [Candidatus Methylacidiphilum fumarolicum]CAI9084679.1 Large exoprotein involved in heme utilization or adhesion [Candidatus Methylacidiphilum fumarolicum]CCG93062.1 Large exoprotein involved in heme utilization or adhesion [Methylacidiphilum fumariolicum SolV]
MNKIFLRKLYKAILLLAAGLWLSLGQKGWAGIPLPGTLPGNGQVVTGTASYSLIGTNEASLSVIGPTAILWGSSAPTLHNVTGSAPGFNIGSSATLIIVGNSVLNVDVTGNPSYIMGTLKASATPVFVANGSGIIVGPGASITAPGGIGLLGYDLSSQATGFNGTVSVFSNTPAMTSSSVTIQSGATISTTPGATYASILVAAPQVNIGIAHPNSITYSRRFDVLSGYEFTGYTPANGSYIKSPTVIDGSAGSITITGPSISPFIFKNSDYFVSSGNITTNGNLVLPGGDFKPVHNTYTEWGLGNKSDVASGVLTNNGTLAFASPFDGGRQTGSLVNNGTILANGGNLYISVGGSITNNGTIDGGGFNVILKAGVHGTPIGGGGVTPMGYLIGTYVIGGGINNSGTISGFNGVTLEAANVNHLGPYPLGGISNTGTINITNPSGSTSKSTLTIDSATGSVFLFGSVHAADPNGLAKASFTTNRSGNFVMDMDADVTAAKATFHVDNLTGSGVLTASTVTLDVTGNVRNVVSQTNPLLNGFTIANGPSGSTNITIDADGIRPQILNLHVNGNAVINSGDTSTFVNKITIPTTGLTTPVANSGGNLLVNATGNLTVTGSSLSDFALSTDILGLSNAFVFPGGVALKAGGIMTVNTSIDNGYTVHAGPNFQGVFLSAPQIFVSGPFVTNGNTIVHATGPIIASVYVTAPASTFTPNVYTAVLSTQNGPVVSPFPWQ